MTRLRTIFPFALAGALGGSAAWLFIILVSNSLGSGLVAEIAMGGIAGVCIGGALWSREALAGRQFAAAARRASLGAAAGLIGGAAGALLGNRLFTVLGRLAADRGGAASLIGIGLSIALGWAVLGLAVGMSGGLMIRSRERAIYGMVGGCTGGFVGGVLFHLLSATSVWSSLAGLFLLGLSIGALISLVEEAFVSARVKVVKGRHLGREFPLLKDENRIGRDDRADVCLSGAEGVGLQHASITRRNGHYSLVNGPEGPAVFINNEQKRNSRLADGDIIRVGSVLLLFSAVKKAAAVALLITGFQLAGLSHPGGALAAGPASVTITQFDVSDFPTVKAYLSVLDREGRPVRGISAGDIALIENGERLKPRGMTFSGSAGEREPLSLAMVIDRSGSMIGSKIEAARESVTRFLSHMEEGDRASIITFSDEVAELASLDSDRTKLERAVNTIRPEGHTALYDAIARGVGSVQSSRGRRAVVVLSDGIANRGALDISQAIETGVKANVSVYVIGLGRDVRTARLERIAHETGGTYFFTPGPEGLAAVYETISRRIRNEYVITYRTQQRGDYLRNVTVKLDRAHEAGRAYFQPGSSLFGSGSTVPGWAFAVPLASFLGFIALSFKTLERSYANGHLSVVRGKGSRSELDITDGMTIGRDERNDLGLFRDDSVDQRHAAVHRTNGTYVIEDQGSAMGTYVNSKRVSGRQALKDGDVIDIGKTRIVFSEATGMQCACGAPLKKGAKFCQKCGNKTKAI